MFYDFLDLRDTLIQGLVTFSCYPECLKALERLPLERYVVTQPGQPHDYTVVTLNHLSWVLLNLDFLFTVECKHGLNFVLQSRTCREHFNGSL
jgi:hypothetical protein